MTIKQQGGIFGRNPTFNDVTVDDTLTAASQVKTPILVNGVASGTLTIGAGAAQNTGANILMYGESHPQVSDFLFRAGTTGLVRIQDSGEVKILNGNLRFDTAGTGIDFSATSGTGTSELFDDYEEGQVANPLYVGGVQVTSGYSASAVTYTKVGDTVMMNFYVDYTSPAGTGPSGNVTIGLPFTPTNSAIAGMSLYMSVSAPSYAGAYISVASGVGTAAVTEANINTIYSLAQGERIIFRAATAYRAS